MNEREQAEKDGASARALGRDLLTNPYYVAGGMPSVTGEKLEAWHAKAVAWEVGWRAEDSARAGTSASSAGLPMTPERARMIVAAIGPHKYLKLGRDQATLDGSYTPEQLEAIALVLRAGKSS
jgi:hypothetical protein